MTNIEVVGLASTGLEAIDVINDKKPDLVLLDIQMPEINGMELLSFLKYKPQIIFTTAYDNYAIEAFENSSTDYLLKPFPLARLKSAIDKAHAIFHQQLANDNRVSDEVTLSPSHDVQRLISKSNDRIRLLYPEKIFFIKGEQGSCIATDLDGPHILSETL